MKNKFYLRPTQMLRNRKHVATWYSPRVWKSAAATFHSCPVVAIPSRRQTIKAPVIYFLHRNWCSQTRVVACRIIIRTCRQTVTTRCQANKKYYVLFLRLFLWLLWCRGVPFVLAAMDIKPTALPVLSPGCEQSP